MNRQTSAYVLGALGVAILAGLVWWGNIRQGALLTEGPIKIGAIYTLTGVSSDIGNALREGTELAVEEITKRGGIQGRPVEVTYEDAPDQSPKATVSAAQKLIHVDGVRVILDMPYSGLGSVRALAEQSQVPVLDVIDSSDEIASFGDWIFGGGIYADGVGEQVAKFAREKLRVQRVATLVGKDEYVLAVTNGFSESFKELDGTVVAREEFLVGTTDFRTQLTKLIANRPEAIFVGHLGEGGSVVKQAAELGYTGYFLGSDTFSLGEVRERAGKALDNRTYFALWRNFDNPTLLQNAFALRYREKYGKEAGDYLFYNVLGYDGFMVAAEALQHSDLSPESIKSALYQISNYSGLSGRISIDSLGINRDPKSMMVLYSNGEIVRADE